ncbi:MAG: hypothetical protein RSD36_16230 [Terrisporobacter sp.]
MIGNRAFSFFKYEGNNYTLCHADLKYKGFKSVRVDIKNTIFIVINSNLSDKKRQVELHKLIKCKMHS